MPPSQTLNRRQLAKGAAWSAPAVLATVAVPAYAASVEPTYTLQSGAFVQVINTNSADPFNTILGVSSYSGGSSVPNGDLPVGASAVAGAGKFTPGGTLGEGLYGGAGFWVSTPVSEQTNLPAPAGITILPAGITFTLSYAVRFAEADLVYEPLLWSEGKVEKVVGSASAGNELNRNMVPFTATFGPSQIVGDTWTGTVSYVTTQDVTLLYSRAEGAIQVLASHVPVTYDISDGIIDFLAEIQVASFTASRIVEGVTENQVIPPHTEAATLIF